MELSDITSLLDGQSFGHYDGYPPTGTKLPYVVSRPMLIDLVDFAISGDDIDWDYQFTLYCCAGSVGASFNLAQKVMLLLQGQRIGDTTLAVYMGYAGAPVEGHYESQVTVQLNKGGI